MKKKSTKSKNSLPAISSRFLPWLIAAGFLLTTFAIYSPALDGEFIWDDEKIYIGDNELLRDPNGIFKFWFSNEPVDYFPLTYTSFWLEWQVAGTNPLLYHITNVACHAATAFVLYLLLAELKVPWAIWLSALFLVHPIQVESVAWISQRKTVLSVMLGFLACYFYARHRSATKIHLSIAASACFALSVAAKPTLITLPVALAVVEWISIKSSVREIARRLWLFFAIAAVLGVVGVIYQQKLISFVDVREQTFVERLVTMNWTFLFYLRQVFAVWTLTFVYPRWDVSATSLLDWLPTLIVLSATFGLWRYRALLGINAFVAWCVAWITLFPSLGLVDVFYWRYSYVGDHYVYQSLPAFLVMLAYLLTKPAKRIGQLPQRVTAILLTCVLAVVSYSRAELYESPQRLWDDTVKANPKAGVAWWNLGALQQSPVLLLKAVEVQPSLFEVWLQLATLASIQGDGVAALEYYRKGEEAAPVKVSEHLSCLIGQVGMHIRFKDLPKAQDVLQTIDRRIARGELIDPIPSSQQLALHVVRLCFAASNAQAEKVAISDFTQDFRHLLESQKTEASFTTIAQTCEDCGAVEAAIEAYQSLLNWNPQHAGALSAVGRCYIEMGRFEESETFLRKAIQSGDATPETQISLGVALMNLGRMSEGLQVFEAAAEGNHLYFRLWSNLGLAYAVNGRPKDAYRAWSVALQINHDDISTLRDLAWLVSTNEALSTQPDLLQSAIRMAQRAWDLSERSRPDCLDSLAAAYASAGKFPQAVGAMQTAIELLKAQQASEHQLEALKERLTLYNSGKAYRE